MKYTTEEILEFKKTGLTAYTILTSINPNLSYPTIRYSDYEGGWEEFNKCFNIEYDKYWANKLRTKYAEGKECYSAIGRN